MEFIEGEGIYNNKFDCIREVIQNALDATKIRLYDDIKSGRFNFVFDDKELDIKKYQFSSDVPYEIINLYPINIALEESKKSEDSNKKIYKFTIEDSGCGISLSDLKRIEKVGSSWNSNLNSYKKIKEMPEWMRPTGSFGIGLHSLFMITDKVEIKTKSDEECAYSIEFSSSKENGFISVSEDKDLKRVGTKISFEFKNESLKELNLENLNNDIKELIIKKENGIDIIDEEYENKLIRNRVECIINSYVQSIKDFRIITSGVLQDKQLSNNMPSRNGNYTPYDDVEINVQINEEKKNIYAFVRDKSNGSELEFSLLDKEQQHEDDNIPVIFKAIGLKGTDGGRDQLLGKGKLYYKNIYCQGFKFRLFNISLNYVSGQASELLSVNRNNFKNIELLEEELKRIKDTIIPKVVQDMFEFINENNYKNHIVGINERIIKLYYSNFCNEIKNLHEHFKESEPFNCIRKIGNDGNNQETSLKELIKAEKIIVTRTTQCSPKIIDLAKQNNVIIIIDDVNFKDFDDLSFKLNLLGFNKINYINNDTYIAYKGLKDDRNIIFIDYNNKKAVRNYLYMLFPVGDYAWDQFKERFYVHKFKFDDKENSVIDNLVVKGDKIISPFTKSCKGKIEKGISRDEIITILRKDFKYDALIEYVIKNNSNKNIEREKVEVAYEELIDEYIEMYLK